jgi:hypothetical protein
MFPPPQASPFLANGFAMFGIAVACGVVWLRWIAARRRREPHGGRAVALTAVIVAAWLGATWAIAASGLLARFDLRPPPFFFLVVAIAAASVALAAGPIGTAIAAGVPLWGLVLAQGFRLPLELLMHEAVGQGVMPNQMSYSGANFDIVTGGTAIAVAALLASGRGGRRLAAAWNVVGMLLLANILTIAIISTPALAAFGPDRLNTWVAFPPFVWLPAVMVAAAIAGHIVVWRRLRRQP